MIRKIFGIAALIATLAAAAVPASAGSVTIDNTTTTGGAWITMYFEDVITGKKIVKAFCAEPNKVTTVSVGSKFDIARAQIEEPNCGKHQVADLSTHGQNPFKGKVSKSSSGYTFVRTP